MRGAAIGLTICLAACASHSTGPQPFSNAPPSLHSGQVALENNQPGFASSIAEARLAVDPGNLDDILLRAQAEAAQGQTLAAVADFRKVLAARPYSPEASIGLARQQMATDPRGAEALMAGVAVYGKPTPAVWNDLGVAEDLLGRHDEAQKDYRNAIAGDPLMQAAQANLARSLAMSGGR